jgi:hypothetical protein
MKLSHVWYFVILIIMGSHYSYPKAFRSSRNGRFELAGFSNRSQASNKIDLIKAFHVEKNRIRVEVENSFKKNYLLDDFFVVYDEDIDLTSLDNSLLIIPFIMNVISIVWISGMDYYIDSLDADLYDSLLKVKKVIQRLYPNTSWNGNLIPRKLVKNRAEVSLKDPNKELALLFSGGLDSTSSALSYLDKKLLLITLRGHWNVPLEQSDSQGMIWKSKEQASRDFAKRYGHTNAFVGSNFSEFLNWDHLESLSEEIATWRLDTSEGIGLFGLVAPLLYIKGYSVIRIAASYDWTYPWPSSSNPLVDNNLRFADSFQLAHDQFDYTRADKVDLLIKLARQGSIDRPKLSMCDGRNVGHCADIDCSKCIPTAFMILALGDDPSLYGLNLSEDEIIKGAKNYLAHKHLYSTLWEFQDLRNKMRDRGYDQKYSWFMNLDLKLLIAPHKKKKRLNWQAFKDLAPESLVISERPTIMLL